MTPGTPSNPLNLTDNLPIVHFRHYRRLYPLTDLSYRFTGKGPDGGQTEKPHPYPLTAGLLYRPEGRPCLCAVTNYGHLSVLHKPAFIANYPIPVHIYLSVNPFDKSEGYFGIGGKPSFLQVRGLLMAQREW